MKCANHLRSGLPRTRLSEMFTKIENKIRNAKKALKQLHYSPDQISAKEFHDYMTGDTFSEDTTTLRDVLGNEFLMIHELVELSELKKVGREISKHTVMESPKAVIYTAHFTAMEQELRYALLKKDFFWIKVRLRQHKESVLEDDPNLPEALRPRGEEILKTFKKRVAESA